MNLVYNIILILTAIAIIIYDYKIQKIPMWLLIINYSSICLLINEWLLIGILYIILAKIKDFPIDGLYVIMIIYLIIIVNSNFSLLSILVILLNILLTSRPKISFMISLEIAIIIELLLKEMLI